jgi:lysozyme family protein
VTHFRRVLQAGLFGVLLSAAPGSAQTLSLFDVAMSGARVDRSDHEAVQAVQRDLTTLGFYTGPIDGVFGPLTYAAAVAAVEAANQETFARQEQARAAQTHTMTMAMNDGGDGDGPSAAAPGPASPAGDGGSSGSASASTDDGPVATAGPGPSGPGPSNAGASAGGVSGLN